MAKYNHNINGNIVPFTAEEEAARDAEIQAWNDGKLDRKKSEMRKLRNQYLKDTDWWFISEQITDAQKTWRQNLRNLPADNTTLEEVELVLARDSDGKLTHSIWEKP
tara:strand:+ start:872 stop:1192 length:321 start_codon:yes stop_codon:yes gene_type:complete